MKKAIKLLAITIIIAMLMLFTIVDASTLKTEKIVEALEELVKSYDGAVNYEDYKIEIEWNTPNSKSNEIVFSYNGNVIEYNSGKITSYEEAEDVISHIMYAVDLMESTLKLNGYSKEEIKIALNSENNLSYEINGIEIEQTGEAEKFTSEDGNSITVSPMSIKIDVSKANLNTSLEESLPITSTTVSDVVDNLLSDSEFTATEYEGKVVYENEIYNDDDTITIVHTYHWEDYHSAYFYCDDDVLSYEDETIEDYYDAERSLSEAMYADVILSTALKMNGYTVEEIQEFLSKNDFDYEINGIEYKEIGEKKSFTSSDGLSTVTATPISFKIDLEKANLNKPTETTPTYTVTFNSNGGSSVEAQTVNSGDKVTKPSNPTKSGYAFKEWQKDGVSFDFATVIIEDIELKAVWTVKSSTSGGGSSSSRYKVTTKTENASITPNISSVKKGATQEFTFKANEGYEITDVLVDGKSVGVVDSYKLEKVTEKHTIEVKTVKESSLENVDDWAKEEMAKAEDKGLIPETFVKKDASKAISRLDFVAVAVKLYEAISEKKAESVANNPFTDTNDEYVLKAYALGITLGTSETTFTPNSEITREQMATMLTRALNKAGIDVTLDLENATRYADDSDLSDWGRASVYFMAKEEIIKGIGDNRFNGLGNAKVEEAIAIALRSVDKFSRAK